MMRVEKGEIVGEEYLNVLVEGKKHLLGGCGGPMG